jgi:hypothetical protein
MNNKLQKNLEIFKNIEIYIALQPPSPGVGGYPIKIKMRPLKTQVSVAKVNQHHKKV